MRKLWYLLLLTLGLALCNNVLAADHDEVLEIENVYHQCIAIENASSTEEVILVRQLLEDYEIGDWEKYDSNKDA